MYDNSAKPLEKRRLGATKLKVTTLSVGSASLAGNMAAVPEAEARSVVSAAYDAGIRYFDTAPYYGFGKAEHYMGDALRGKKDYVLSTKVGRVLVPAHGKWADKHNWKEPFPFDQIYDFGYDAIMRSFEDSLQRLGLDHVDILFVHDIGDPGHGTTNEKYWRQLKTGGYKALNKLKKDGLISAIGLGSNEWDIQQRAMGMGDWDVMLLAGRYTLLEQGSLSPFLELCLKRKTSIVCGGPFNSGILAGGMTWNYARAPKKVVEKVMAIEAVCRDYSVPLPAAALQFPLKHKAIASVLPGPRTPAEFNQIWDWWHLDIPKELWTSLRAKGLIDPKAPI